MSDAAWFIDHGYRVIPTQPHNAKFVVKGYGKHSVCTAEVFSGGRGIKLITGPQPSGEFIACLDDDIGGSMLARVAEHCPSTYKKLVIRASTSSKGLHAWFKTALDLHTTAVIDATGKVLIELKARGGIGVTAPSAEEMAQVQTLTDEETRAILALFSWKDAPEPQPQPERPPRPTTASGDVIADINARLDLFSELGLQQKRGTSYRCPFHEDKQASLEIRAATACRNGAYVCRCWSPACRLGDGRWYSAFDVYCIKHECSPKEAIKVLNPLPGEPEAHRAAHKSTDAERKRTARRAEAERTRNTVFDRAGQDREMSDGALDTLIDLLAIAGDRDWCRPSNARLAERRNVEKRTIQRRIKELEKRGYIRTVEQVNEHGEVWSGGRYTAIRQFVADISTGDMSMPQVAMSPVLITRDHDHVLVLSELGKEEMTSAPTVELAAELDPPTPATVADSVVPSSLVPARSLRSLPTEEAKRRFCERMQRETDEADRARLAAMVPDVEPVQIDIWTQEGEQEVLNSGKNVAESETLRADEEAAPIPTEHAFLTRASLPDHEQRKTPTITERTKRKETVPKRSPSGASSTSTSRRVPLRACERVVYDTQPSIHAHTFVASALCPSGP